MSVRISPPLWQGRAILCCLHFRYGVSLYIDHLELYIGWLSILNGYAWDASGIFDSPGDDDGGRNVARYA